MNTKNWQLIVSFQQWAVGMAVGILLWVRQLASALKAKQLTGSEIKSTETN